MEVDRLHGELQSYKEEIARGLDRENELKRTIAQQQLDGEKKQEQLEV